MSTDMMSLIMRVAMLMLLAASSETAAKKRLWPVALLTGAIWITIFRLAFLRAVFLYAGAFAHEPSHFIDNIMRILSSSNVTNWSDFLLLLGCFGIFYEVAKYKYKLPVKKQNAKSN